MVDPAYPKKLQQGRIEDIRPCARCMHCVGKLWLNVPIECRWNAFMGHEHEIKDATGLHPGEEEEEGHGGGGGPGRMEELRGLPRCALSTR